MDIYVKFGAIIQCYHNKEIYSNSLAKMALHLLSPGWAKRLWMEQSTWMSCTPSRLRYWGSPGRPFTETITEKTQIYTSVPGDFPLYFWYSHNKIQYILTGFKVKHDFIIEILKANTGSILNSLRDSFDDVSGYHKIRCTKDIYFRYNCEKHLFFWNYLQNGVILENIGIELGVMGICHIFYYIPCNSPK